MRVTNDVKSYIRKEVWAKAEGKYNALKAEAKKVNDEVKAEHDKFYNEQEVLLRDVSRKLVALAKKHGLTIEDKKDVIKGFNEWSFVERHYHPKPLADAERAADNFKNDVEHAIHGIIFKLEAGGKSSDILKMIEEIQF